MDGDEDTQQDAQPEGAEGQGRDAGRWVIPCCQVQGCQASMLSEKRYCQKKKVCNEHMQADNVYKTGDSIPWRFCFQCGKLEMLTLFDGAQRSCRARLQLRRKPKRSGSGSGAGPWRELAGTARKAKRSRLSVSHTQHSSSQQRHGGRDGEAQHWDEPPQVDPTQCAGSKQEAPGCDAGGFGCTADSCQGDSAGGVAAAAAAAVTDAVAARCPPKTASRSADAASVPSLGRTSTAASAKAVSALMLDLGPGLNEDPHTGGASEPLLSPTALHMASLQEKCQVIQRQLQQSYSMHAASCSRGVAAILQAPALAAETAPVLQQRTFSLGAVSSSRGVAAILQAPALAAETAPVLQQRTLSLGAVSSSRGVAAILQPPALPAAQPAPVLQRLPAWDSPTPSPESALTAQITAADHMEMVEMVVAQLDDSDASAEAAELEALLEHELRAAASLPVEDARNTWACQINEVINDWSSAISAAALLSLSAAAAPAGCTLTAPAAAGTLPLQQLGGYGLGFNTAAGAPAPAGADGLPFNLRLVSLQQQLNELQGMVHNLRTEFMA